MTPPKTQWRIDKHIPVAVIVAFLVQAIIYTGLAVWAVSKIDNRIMFLEQWRAELVAASDMREVRVQSLERDVPVIREKIENINRTTDRIEEKLDKISLNRMGSNEAPEMFFAMDLEELGEVSV